MALQILCGLQILNVERGALNNSILCQMGVIGTGAVESETAQYIQQSGFVSIPPQPQAGQTTSESLVLRGISNRDYVFATRDVLSQQMYANMNYGEVMIYAAGADGNAQAKIKCDQYGNIILYTKDDNTVNGNGMTMTINTSANGGTPGFGFYAAFGSFVFDATGLHINHVTGASMDLGGINLPAPLASAVPTTFLNVNAGSITMNGICNLGVAGPTMAYLPMVSAIAPQQPPQPLPPFTTTPSATVFAALGI